MSLLTPQERDVLIWADIEQIPQVIGMARAYMPDIDPSLVISRGAGQDIGYCALGIITHFLKERYRNDPVVNCLLCEAETQTYYLGRKIRSQHDLIVHLNNDHRMTFREIADKMP